MDSRTTYSIIDIHGEKSSITIEKMVADALQSVLPDVHQWVQGTYDRVAAKKPELGRREQGDLVRLLAYREANKYPIYQKLLDEYFGPSL